MAFVYPLESTNPRRTFSTFSTFSQPTASEQLTLKNAWKQVAEGAGADAG